MKGDNTMKKPLLAVAKSRTKLLMILFAVEIIVFTFSSPYFLNWTNLLEITQFGAVLMLVALGESIVILSGQEGIDLSVGAMLSLSGVMFGVVIKSGAPFVAAVLACLLTGVLLGSINGLLVAIIKMPPLIVTLGTQYLYGSLALYITRGIPISGFPEYYKWLSLKTTLGIPNQVLFVVLPITVLVLVVVYKTKFGRRVYLLGSSPLAARFAGVREKHVRFYVFLLVGVLVSIGALINNSWLMTARADAGSGMEMQAITVAVLGGISIIGGGGQLSSVIIAVIIITVMNSGLQLANINSVWQMAILGFVLILAIVFNLILNHLVFQVRKDSMENTAKL
jgi:ribose/xylose/arabinose/galactoside ABC-type transport system permease subunit